MLYDLENLKGQTLGQYELIDLLGTGGMGAVYRAYQPALQREVAVKVIFGPLIQDSQQEARFSREAHLAASLEHAHIVPVYDYGTAPGVRYVVMRLLDGGSLLDYTGREKPLLPLVEVSTITRHLASALQYAHGRNIIHRDVKASNVMFDEQGTVFLVDFGIAQIAGTTSDLSLPGNRVGTPDFMAPEQWRSEELTPAVDQYALAILVYHMLTGHLPFNGEMPHQLMHSHLNDLPTPLSHWRDDLPTGALMPVLNRALQKDPVNRYADVDIFARAFENALQSALDARRYSAAAVVPDNQPHTLDVYNAAMAPMAYPPERRRRRRRSPWRRISLVLLLLALLSVVAFVIITNFASQQDDPNIVSALDASPTVDTLSGSETALAVLALIATDTPTATLTETITASPTELPSSTPTETPTITATATLTETPTVTLTGTQTATSTPTATLIPTNTPIPSETPIPSSTPSPTAIAVALAANPVTFTVPIQTMNPGADGIIDVQVVCPQISCRTLDITIQFDASIIQVDDIELDSTLVEDPLNVEHFINNQDGLIRLIADVNQDSLDEAELTKSLNLHVRALDLGISPLTVARLYVFDAIGQPVNALSIDGGIVVTGDFIPPENDSTCTYSVRPGDTLSAIAAANGVTVVQIHEYNDIPNEYTIPIGRELILPTDTCYAPTFLQEEEDESDTTGTSRVFDVYDCRLLSGNSFEWYQARVDYGPDGKAIQATRTGGPFRGPWQPGCPAPQNSNDSSSSGGSSRSGGSGNSGGTGSNPPPPPTTDPGGGSPPPPTTDPGGGGDPPPTTDPGGGGDPPPTSDSGGGGGGGTSDPPPTSDTGDGGGGSTSPPADP